MQRLGVLGGAFDPIHTGHVLLAQFTAERLDLDQVLFIPAADPPHKGQCIALAEDRWAMVQRAIEGFPVFAASRLELDRPGKSYTIDTLRYLRQAHPETQLYLIIGADNVAPFSTWHNPRGILELCTVVAGTRLSPREEADPELEGRLVQIDTPAVQISSTQIRQRLGQGLPIRYLVPEKVEEHIRRQGLYQAG
ncbi:MAG: nicotinate-nucleotide adenylyltransferase [Candidatus Handelsmanbacteria bacterium]|nr:nicotinate-nucleotide adenylyltransferase [Candidatus Handelsmanbacteria bacterium]